MYPVNHLLSVSMESQTVLDQILAGLRAQGLEVVRSFDLQVARKAHSDCACPHHGTDQCNCQMAVFLVYGKDRQPLTLIAHSRDGHTQISLVEDYAQMANSRLAHRIQQVFDNKLQIILPKVADAY